MVSKRWLRWIDPVLHTKLAKLAHSSSKIVTMDPKGTVLREMDTAPADAACEAQWGKRPLSVGWWELLSVLAGALPESVLRPGATFVRADAAPHGVDVYLQDTVVWRARLPRAQAPEAPDAITFILGGGTSCLVFPISSGDVLWTCSAPVEALEARGLGGVLQGYAERRAAVQYSAAERLDQCLRAFEGYPEVLLQQVRATDPAMVLAHGIWVRPPEEMPAGDTLCDGPWTVLGDAFHPLRQGANIALEDAVVLAAAVAQHGPSPAALRQYEAARLPRVRTVMQQVLAVGRGTYRQDGQATMQLLMDGHAFTTYLNSAEWPDLATLRQAGGGGRTSG
eukprot:scaffold21.g2226.t1